MGINNQGLPSVLLTEHISCLAQHYKPRGRRDKIREAKVDGHRARIEMASTLNRGRWNYFWVFAPIQIQRKGRIELRREEEWRFIPQALTTVRPRENIAFLFIFSKNMESGVK